MTPAELPDIVDDIQPGCSREWTWGTLIVRLHHADTGGWVVSLTEHPAGGQWVSAGLTAQEAARYLGQLADRHPLVDVVRVTPPAR